MGGGVPMGDSNVRGPGSSSPRLLKDECFSGGSFPLPSSPRGPVWDLSVYTEMFCVAQALLKLDKVYKVEI